MNDEHRHKNPQQNFSKQNSAAHQNFKHHDQVGFTPVMQAQLNPEINQCDTLH